MTQTPQQPASHSVVVERTVRADSQRVWDVLTDVAHADQTLSGVTRVQMLSEGPYAVGTQWLETRRMFGKEETEQMRVTAVEAPTRTVVEASSRGMEYTTEFTLLPEGGATRLTMSFSAVQSGGSVVQRVLGRLFAGIGARSVAKVMTKDLDDVAARAERA